uniref:Uncharacterized protein n=1 Tax=Anopheles culicifacies TaxID=139723 RepID=A0A182M6R8_9DIPT
MNFVKPYKMEALVKQWAPLVWLAPNEKYMPGDVSKFLEHVHAEEAKVVTVYPGSEITELDDLKHYDDGMTNELSYYDPVDQRQGRFRNKRNFKDPSVSLDLLFNLPIGNESKNWYLVTNNDIDELITHKESFLHGQNPLKENVPIYAVISMCQHSLSEISPRPDSSLPFTQPATTTAYPATHLLHSKNNQENEVAYTAKDRPQYKRNPYAPTPKNIFELQPNLRQTMNKVEKSIRLIRRKRDLVDSSTLLEKTTDSTDVPPMRDPDDIPVARKVTIDSDDGNGKHHSNTNTDDSVESPHRSDENEEWETITERRHDTERYHSEVSYEYPHFHVTYWMFYPYSQEPVIPCPRCSDRNQRNMMRYLFVNLSEAIYKCEAYDCMYPFRNFKFKNFEESTVYRYELQAQHDFDANYANNFPNSCNNFENTIEHIGSVDFNMDFLPCEGEGNIIQQPAPVEPFSQSAHCNIPSTNFDTGFIDEILEDLFPFSSNTSSEVKEERQTEGVSVMEITTDTELSQYSPAPAQSTSGRKLEKCLKVFEKPSKISEDDVFKKPKAPENDNLVVEHITPTKLRIKRVTPSKAKTHAKDSSKHRERTAVSCPLDIGPNGTLELKQARALVKNKKLKPLDLVSQ